MATKSDSTPSLSANRICTLTGVLPQTRATWADRGLVKRSAPFGQLDVIEQLVVKALLASVPKGDVDTIWDEVRPRLRDFVANARAALVWDPLRRRSTVTQTDRELADLVRHGRPVWVLPLGDLVTQARHVYGTEMRASQRKLASQTRRRAIRGATRPNRG